MTKLIFLGIALFLAARVLGSLFKSSEKNVQVKGESKKDKLDLSDEDVIDVDFKEIKK